MATSPLLPGRTQGRAHAVGLGWRARTRLARSAQPIGWNRLSGQLSLLSNPASALLEVIWIKFGRNLEYYLQL
jgi:hypothetical protein